MTVPWCCDSTSTLKSSNGSQITPSISLKITWGRPTANSKPSRRMVSISIDKCNSPRPDTKNSDGSGVSSTRNATL